MSKRIKQEFTKNADDTENVNISCKICGKPIIKSNDYGMYCEDECGIEDDKAAFEKIKKMFLFFK